MRIKNGVNDLKEKSGIPKKASHCKGIQSKLYKTGNSCD